MTALDRICALVLTGVVAAAAGGTRAAGEAPGYAPDVPQTGEFLLQVDGQPDAKARFFVGEPPVQIVLITGKGPGFVLDRTSQGVRRLVNKLIKESTPGSIRLLPGAVGEPLAEGYKPEGAGVNFKDAGISYTVLSKPPLVGEVTLEKILEHSPEYRFAMDQYSPSAAAVTQLRHCAPTARIEVFYGSWCPFCRRHLPRLLKALEQAKGAPLSVRLVALPKGFTQEKVAAERGVQRVPTLIAFDGLREVGRLQGADWERPEEALVRILPAARTEPAGVK